MTAIDPQQLDDQAAREARTAPRSSPDQQSRHMVHRLGPWLADSDLPRHRR